MYYRQPTATASRQSLVRRVMRLPASFHSRADTVMSANGDIDVKLSATSDSSVTASNGTDTLVTSESKSNDTLHKLEHTVHVTPSTVVHNGSVTLPILQDKVDDTQSNGAVTLASLAVVSSPISTTVSRQ